MHTYHLQALHTVLDVPFNQELQLGGLQRGSARVLALQPLVPCHDIITEEHTQDVSNTTVMGYAGLQVTMQSVEASMHILFPLTSSHVRLCKHAGFARAARKNEGEFVGM